jgi:ribosomal protein S18 acetylase RimI-like enzyme
MAVTENDVMAVRALLLEYAESLPVSLSYQGFDAELAQLPGAYAAPAGALLLATTANGAPVGCIALRAGPAPGIGEIKRLYVRPAARGGGVGECLARAALTAAEHAGYTEVVLDTLPSMAAARALYVRLGFVACAAYYAPTPAGTVFLGRKLHSATADSDNQICASHGFTRTRP